VSQTHEKKQQLLQLRLQHQIHALGQIQERLCAEAVALRKQHQVAANGENIAGIVLFEKQQALKINLSHKDTMDRLRLELSQ